MNKTAIIFGASGLVGTELHRLLLEQEQYEKVIVFVRKTLGISHPKLKEIVGDYEHIDTYKEQFIADDVFCCLGTTIKKAKTKAAMRKVDVEYPLQIANICKEMGATQYILVSASNAKENSFFFYTRIKGEVEKKLKQVGYDALLIVRPSLLLGDRQEFRFGEELATWISVKMPFLFRGPLSKHRPIEAKDVARAMFVLAQQSHHGNFTYTSEELRVLSKKQV
ncbi:NAD(P)H-binding protein [Bacillus alkalicellulosilyticus]|uniref:NAD(P)H-binding protein n=1 Tax=Alkalihalobacterium alkalicellulosilyticum TaxID=1912214 RepID=UPI000995F86C|nr:NAD(P)H-binding protein [Bacillus alkalicellulosilyticus]